MGDDPAARLLPRPRSCERLVGTWKRAAPRIRIGGRDAADLLSAAEVVQRALLTAGLGHHALATTGDAALSIVVDPATTRRHGYRLTLGPNGGELVAHDAAAAFHGAQTFAQLVADGEPAAVSIDDSPDIAVRGAMLDVSRDQVPTMATLRAQIDDLARWKINQLQLYVEHTFAYRAHPEVWAAASPLTGDECRELDAYCRARHIELVPNQNSFGHLERWFRHARYRPLANAPDGFTFKGKPREAYGLDPTDPGSLRFLDGLYRELLPHFTSRMFNVGCDETIDLGQGRSADACASRGVGPVYLDFLKQVHRLARGHGRTIQYWADIALSHPELIGELPRDAVALAWGYEADHPFARELSVLAGAGLKTYVCPGTSSWLSFAGRSANAIGNLRAAANAGRGVGVAGYLITDWGDEGHLQYRPASRLGLAWGAAVAWNAAGHRDEDAPALVSRHAFTDASGASGRIAYDLGDVSERTGKRPMNRSALFKLLFAAEDDAAAMEGITREGLDAAAVALDDVARRIGDARPGGADGALVVDEWRNGAAMLGLAIDEGRRRLDPSAADRAALVDRLDNVEREHRRLWLARNRPGGLDDSCARFAPVRARWSI